MCRCRPAYICVFSSSHKHACLFFHCLCLSVHSLYVYGLPLCPRISPGARLPSPIVAPACERMPCRPPSQPSAASPVRPRDPLQVRSFMFSQSHSQRIMRKRSRASPMHARSTAPMRSVRRATHPRPSFRAPSPHAPCQPRIRCFVRACSCVSLRFAQPESRSPSSSACNWLPTPIPPSVCPCPCWLSRARICLLSEKDLQ